MHVHSLFAGAFVLTCASAAEPQIFHKALFPDATTVDLAMVSAPSADEEYDFDVLITMTERSQSGEIAFRDASRHTAKVRCHPPINVLIGGNDYSVLPVATSHLERDWKRDLWLTLCSQPLS